MKVGGVLKDKNNNDKKVHFDKKTKAPTKFTMSEYSNMMKVMMETSKTFKKNPKSAKRKVHVHSTQGNFLDSDSDREPASTEENNYMNMLTGMRFKSNEDHQEYQKAKKHWAGSDDESVASA